MMGVRVATVTLGCAFIAGYLIAGQPSGEDAAVDLLIARFVDKMNREPKWAPAKWVSSDVDELLSGLNLRYGFWSDIDYNEANPSEWMLAHKHLGRTLELAKIWHTKGDRRCLEAVHRTLERWRATRYYNPNWWWLTVGIERYFSRIGLNLGNELTEAERKFFVEMANKPEPGFAKTGQNKVFIAENRMIAAILDHDMESARKFRNVLCEEVRVTDGEGIQRDWCYHQHGHQPQFANYGYAFLLSQSQTAEMFAGTALAYEPEKIGILFSLAEKGYQWIVWKGMVDVSALGRALLPSVQKEKADGIERAFASLVASGWKRPPDPIGFRSFDRSAYAIYRTDRWMASVRASTPGIIGVETTLNNDNIKGMSMADGALMVYSSGREYEDVFPLWKDWRMIPGVTGYLGRPTFKGDSRNEVDGYSAKMLETGGEVSLDFRREGLSAHKTWVFSPEGIVCEGRSIGATDSSFEVATCVENANAQPNAGVVYERTNESCFRNGNILYTIEAPRSSIKFSIEDRSGDFHEFMGGFPSRPHKGRLFSLLVLHGNIPKDASYRYRISFDEK